MISGELKLAQLGTSSCLRISLFDVLFTEIISRSSVIEVKLLIFDGLISAENVMAEK